MQSDIYYSEPNLLAEVYRNQVSSGLPKQIERHFDFIEISEDGTFLLGTSNLSGRIWSGSIWIFNKFLSEPKVDDCLAGIEFESSIASGLWLDNGTKVIIGCDSGSLQHLTLVNPTDNKLKPNFKINAIVTEHDDSIITLDLMKNKSKIISGGMDMNIKIWDEATLLSEKSYCPAHGHLVTSVSSQVHQFDIYASTSLDGTCLVWDIRLDKPASLLIENSCGYTASAWVDNNYICLGSNDGSISLFDLRSRQELERKFCSKRSIFKIKFNPELEYFAVCADDPIVRIFDVKDRSLNSVYECEKHADFIRGLAWDFPSKTLYSCGWDSKIYSYEVLSSLKLLELSKSSHTMNKNINGVEPISNN